MHSEHRRNNVISNGRTKFTNFGPFYINGTQTGAELGYPDKAYSSIFPTPVRFFGTTASYVRPSFIARTFIRPRSPHALDWQKLNKRKW